jgi:glycine cleavage system H protein
MSPTAQRIQMPENLLYTRRDLWISMESDPFRLGLTEFSVLNRSPVVFVMLGEPKFVGIGEEVCVVESEDAVGSVFSPIDCNIVRYNSRLSDTPSLVSTDAYEAGWIVEVSQMKQCSGLLDRRQYSEWRYLVDRSEEVLRRKNAQPHDLIGLIVDGCEVVSILGWGDEKVVFALRDFETGAEDKVWGVWWDSFRRI